MFMAFSGAVMCAQISQSYLNDTGSTSYGIDIPVENGFINLSNGNLHLEFPFASHPQRGGLTLNESLVYDSRIWMFSPFGSSYHWWPYNVRGGSTTSGGWRFVAGPEPGELLCSGYPLVCTWVDPGGTLHAFSGSTGFASDGSGYSITSNNNGSFNIYDSQGSEVYPQVIDRYGNYWSYDSNGNLIDDTGRTPVIVTQNGNVTYYDVLAPNGPINNNGLRVRYTVTVAPIPVATNFAQSDIYEWNPSTEFLTPVQSIQLPDGSQYTFGYDSYGELSSVTLPTGGVIAYGYSNFVDSSNTVNRWLTSRTVGNNQPMLFGQAILTTCADYSTGCVEQIYVSKPSGVAYYYDLTLNNGAWNTSTSIYSFASGSNPSGVELSQTTNVNTYSDPCTRIGCVPLNHIIKSLQTVEMFGTGTPSGSASVYSQTQTLYDPFAGKVTAAKEWDYMPANGGINTASPPSTTPTRETDYTYTGFDLQSVTVLDSNGIPSGQTTYGYAQSATATSGVPQHGTTNAGGPYLNTISHWNNAGASPVTTYAMDDTGEILSIMDPDQHTPTTISHQCANSLAYQVINALNQTTTYGYDCNSGAITSIQDPNDTAVGRVGATYSYESTAGRIHSITYPDAGTTTYAYPSSAEVDTTVAASPDPPIISASILDSYGRPYQHIQNGVSSETTYDQYGRVECVTNPHIASNSPTDGSTCVDLYDGLDQPLKQQQPDGSIVTWSYSGNTSSFIDESGNYTQQTRDAFGHLKGVFEFSNGSAYTTNYTYDGLGNITRIAQLGNGSTDVPRTRTFTYDSLARLLCVSHPENSTAQCPTTATSAYTSGTIGYSYDPNGNQISKTDARGVTTSLSYDSVNRLLSRSYTDGTPSSCHSYDTATANGSAGIGRLASEWTQIGSCPTNTSTPPANALTATNVLAYDQVGRVTNLQECVFTNCTSSTTFFSLGYSYDLAGNPTGTSLGGLPGVQILNLTRTFDSSGRLNTLGSNWSSSALFMADPTLGYASPGGLQKATFGSGILLNRTYDNRLRVTGEMDTSQ
jgi:YD repeat-containing protein